MHDALYLAENPGATTAPVSTREAESIWIGYFIGLRKARRAADEHRTIEELRKYLDFVIDGVQS